ncbi:YlmH/Sll1252 family protein [Lachnoclostridium sp. Marseille-P6806]|uniref:YlmH/Sll1252 family protein n=1 Tax=Lachnoclostridium sp. Marseille-P6806 TaxID=2364793 RepID=UPI0010319099|nr:YlmH/Sll1252 family protein [Lachnoclostridium sp. Marseille-P6806]
MAEEWIRKRILELAEQSERRQQYLFTDFLNEAEQAEAFAAAGRRLRTGRDGAGNEWAVCQKLPGVVSVSGGREGAERVMLRFGNPETFGYEEPFPIAVLRIASLHEKFGEELSHRDYLGALLHLGIERRVLGDILIDKKTAYLFAERSVAPFLAENLTQIRHTRVSCEPAPAVPEALRPKLAEETFPVASERLDAILAQLLKLSRSQSLELFRAGRVFVNGAVTENGSASPGEGDVISVRGFGRMIYRGVSGTSRKGKLYVTMEKYV